MKILVFNRENLIINLINNQKLQVKKFRNLIFLNKKL